MILTVGPTRMALFAKELSLMAGPQYNDFLTQESTSKHPPVQVQVHAGKLTPKGKKLFTATNLPEFEHLPDTVWEVYAHENNYLIHSHYNNGAYQLAFSLDSNHWNLYIEHPGQGPVQPLAQPLDSLIFYYAAMKNQGIMLHASAVNYKGKGLLFSGFSGRGKSTIARLFVEQGAQILNDDRILIHANASGFCAFNTPMFYPDSPRKTPLDAIFLIRHHHENALKRLGPADALTQLAAFTIQHHYNKQLIARVLDQLMPLVQQIPVYTLGFLPDASVVEAVATNLSMASYDKQ